MLVFAALCCITMCDRKLFCSFVLPKLDPSPHLHKHHSFVVLFTLSQPTTDTELPKARHVDSPQTRSCETLVPTS